MIICSSVPFCPPYHPGAPEAATAPTEAREPGGGAQRAGRPSNAKASEMIICLPDPDFLSREDAAALQPTQIGKAKVAYPAIKRLLIHIFAL